MPSLLSKIVGNLFASLLILITKNCFVRVISSNSARTGRSDQCPGCRRHDLVWAAVATTWLSVCSVATCKFRAAASLAPRRRAWASASKDSKSYDVATWNIRCVQQIRCKLVRRMLNWFCHVAARPQLSNSWVMCISFVRFGDFHATQAMQNLLESAALSYLDHVWFQISHIFISQVTTSNL